ncbi:MAG: signal transduction histidine kinase [Paracoccaceae bacterium]|jgi:signal transduction histidine kinase
MKILIVEDSEAEAFLIETLFRSNDSFAGELVHVTDMEDARTHLEGGSYDIAFIDHYLGSEKGTSLIRGAGGRRCPTPMVLMSGLGSAEVEAEALAAGAMDYVDKNLLSAGVLHRTVKFALKNHEQTLQARSNELYHREMALEARVSNDEKSNFLANMSHEFRTPLNAIIGFAELIQLQEFGEIHGSGAERYKDHVDDIHHISQHVLKLVDDLLDLARVEAGNFEIDLQETSLNDVVDDVVLMTLMQASEKNIGLEFDIPDSLPAFSADPRLLAQVLINLVANAIKHTPQGGRIDVSATLEERNLVVTVRDNGSGISQADISRLSEPYFKSIRHDSERKIGTGLGLSVSKSIMETHLGGISIGNRNDGGTTVKIWLPTNLDTLNRRPS